MTGIGAGFFAAAVARLTGFTPELELLTGVLAACSTTMPDWLEVPIHRNGQLTGRLIAHRTLTHWGLMWLVLLLWGAYTAGLAGTIVLGAATGSLFHLLGDAPNPMGVPWLWPTKRIRLGKNGWWKSGQNEFFLILVLTSLGMGAWYLVSNYAGPISLKATLADFNFLKLLN